MPRKEYKTITVKEQAFVRFLKAVHDAKKANPGLDNSLFLEKLLDHYKKKG
ncbi:MAG TPA: hypothetical protein VJ771_07935 [Candidatus Nitrosotalea sp.]|nr:hypothetical protein [Candidatus Nitrosotalea sp.]